MEDNSKLCKKAKECSSNHYFSVEINNCKNCHDSCKTCSNLKIGQKEIDSCIECAGSKKKLQITDPSSPSNSVYNCVDCDTNKGFYSDNIKCYKCQVEFCDVCLSENGSNCSKCSSGKYLLNNKCVDCDQVGYYKTEDSSLGGQCNQCSSNCKECDGPYNQKCKQCIDNYYFNENKECVTCPDELFYKLNGECKSCHQNCLKCENGNNESDCTVCKNNMYLIDGMCQTCPTSKYFEKRSTKQCLKCDDSCETCSDQRIENCTLCKDGFYFSEENGKKLCKSCDENNGFFIDSNSFCKPCHQSCITCYGQGANQCSICRHGLHLMKDSTCVECNSSNGLFVDNETQMCEKCHSTCKTCDGASQNSCLDCKEGQFLTIDRMCSECKGYGEYQDIQTKKCFKCHDSCQSCDGPNQNNCLTCKAQLYYFKQEKQHQIQKI
ncbi:hypothetical protein ABPG74_017193 [Tetrahymena malaccensis]